MKKRIELTILAILILSSIYGQNNLRGPLDTVKLSETCELIIPEKCDRHDYWVIESNCRVEQFKLEVFNNWGTLVFETDSLKPTGFALAHGHSKIINGEKHEYSLPDGNYFWVIRMTPANDNERTIEGEVKIEQFIE